LLVSTYGPSIVVSTLTFVVVVCWAWIISMAVDMYGRMTGPAMWMMTARWDGRHLVLLFAMWSVMMVGMMLPSGTPAVLQYARTIRSEPHAKRPTAHIAVFATGYVFVWTLFSLAATIVHRAIAEARLLTPMMEPTMPAFAGWLLLNAGGYQLLPFKRRCLSSCRSPAAFGTNRRRPGVVEAFRIGMKHGLSCVGCCWVLMMLLFAGGVMNLTVIVTLTLIVLLERIAPFGIRSTLVSGGGLIGLGLWVMAR
jgi:predicted metal-binding membrane protein